MFCAILGGVDRYLAIVLLFFVSVAVLADPLDCPDGCANADGQSSSQVSPIEVDFCVWCLGVSLRLAPPLDSPEPVFTPTVERVSLAPRLGSLPAIEHPPRG